MGFLKIMRFFLILAQMGIEVTVAEDGVVAVERVKQQSFDTVLMDIQMPRLDGFGATQQIREMYGAEELPIIAMTANAMQEDRQKAIDAGMNDYLSKPIDKTLLLSVIDKWLPAPDEELRSENTAELVK